MLGGKNGIKDKSLGHATGAYNEQPPPPQDTFSKGHNDCVILKC